jgi:hypothetical protein
MSYATTESPAVGARAELHRVIVAVAARELERALLAQSRPPMGMFAQASSAEDAALHRAVGNICGEARRLALQAEDLIIGIKQAWSQLAAIRAHHLGDRDGDVLREVVSNSIEVFFESHHAASRKIRN